MSTNYLREQRLGRALSAEQVAASLGVHPTSILRWERRERFPAPVHLHGLARVLRVYGEELGKLHSRGLARDRIERKYERATVVRCFDFIVDIDQ